MNPHQLDPVEKDHISAAEVEYFTKIQWPAENSFLKPPFSQKRTLPDARNLHYFQPIGRTKVISTQLEEHS